MHNKLLVNILNRLYAFLFVSSWEKLSMARCFHCQVFITATPSKIFLHLFWAAHRVYFSCVVSALQYTGVTFISTCQPSASRRILFRPSDHTGCSHLQPLYIHKCMSSVGFSLSMPDCTLSSECYYSEPTLDAVVWGQLVYHCSQLIGYHRTQSRSISLCSCPLNFHSINQLYQ